MRSSTPREIEPLLRGDEPPLLVDVREPFELDIARLDGALHLPLNEIPDRLSDLPRDRTLVLVCHHGIRSAYACAYLADQGFENLINLAGGIDEWARTVDPEMPRY